MPSRRPSTDDPDDALLCERAQRGDRAAWRSIVRRHTPSVYRLAARMLGAGAEAEDACQEAFMQAYRSFEHFDLSRPLGPWLGRVTYHTCLKRLAKTSRQAPPMDPSEVARVDAGGAASPELQASSRQPGQIVLAALDELSAQDRALVTLRYMDGLTDLEVSEAVGMNHNTVRTRLHRARLVLQRVLAPLIGGGRNEIG